VCAREDAASVTYLAGCVGIAIGAGIAMGLVILLVILRALRLL
jgi:hypothetical protein